MAKIAVFVNSLFVLGLLHFNQADAQGLASRDYREALEAGCRGQADENDCAMRAIHTLSQRGNIAGFETARESVRERAKLSCLAEKKTGLLEYDDCLRSHFTASAGGDIAAKAAPSSPASQQPVAQLPASQPPVAPAAIRPETSGDPERVFALVSDSVYYVVAGPPVAGKVKTGSAVAIDPHHLLTNCHVVASATEITLSDGEREWEATKSAGSIGSDRCILYSANIVRPLKGVRSYESLHVGEHVFTVGNPSGYQRTLGDGLVSGLRKDKDGIRLVQTTAPISHGSSGGGLFDAEGQLIGITTFYVGETGSLNFAIAASEFMALVSSETVGR